MQRIRFLFVIELFLVFLMIVQAMGLKQIEPKEISLGIVDFGPLQPVPDVEAKEQISLLVNDIFEKNRKLLQGVEEVVVYTEEIRLLRDGQMVCDDHILGAFSGKKILIKDAGEEVNEHTLYHEIGHNLWGQLNAEQRQEWMQLFKEKPDVFSRYANLNENENFSENFACYFSDLNGCREKLYPKKVAFIEKVLNG